MKILAFADVHGRFERVTAVLQQMRPVDLVLVAGDLTTNGTPAEVERALAVWMSLAPQLFAVAGNMDSPQIDRALERLEVSLNGCCRRAGAIPFFGCSAAPVSIGTPYEIAESEIAARIERGFAQAQGARPVVLVPHAPPHGCVDLTWSHTHAGSRAVREFIERSRPALVVCGHIHEARGQERLGDSLVVNCGSAASGHYASIDLDEHGCRAELF